MRAIPRKSGPATEGGVEPARAWPSPADFPRLSRRAPILPALGALESEAAARGARPHVFLLTAPGSAVLVYGCSGTRDPRAPEIADLVARWMALRPGVTLIGDRVGCAAPGRASVVRRYGAGGAIHDLARRRGVPVYSVNASRELIAERLLESFPATQVALHLVLAPYFAARAAAPPTDPDDFVEGHRRRWTRDGGPASSLPNLAAVEARWRRDFPGAPDWREISAPPGYLAAIAARARGVPEERLIEVMLHLAERGERVFAVAPAEQAYRVEPALRAAWRWLERGRRGAG